MKQLTTTEGRFGPFHHIEELEDRYRGDGADLPHSVVGMGVVEDWQGDLPIPRPPVPESVDRAQARLALQELGKLHLVETAIDQLDSPVREVALIEWMERPRIRRASPVGRAPCAGARPERRRGHR